jgi:2-C-methyl-D-erythritol 4-phosphate cytidylyltransferase/2-C-methyl-D-erythritol 2,4-cyclodiphosphate synthase
MGGTDKLDIDIGGRPVLRRSVEAMRAATEVADIIIVTSDERARTLRDVSWLPEDTRIIAGGSRRQDSVAMGVAAATSEVVLVHDAARPLVSTALIGRVARAAAQDGAAIPVLPVVDALKRVDDAVVDGTVERAGLYLAQTPQGAHRELLAAAAEAHAGSKDLIADEAELLARDGIRVTTVPGDAVNLKITVPEDVELARRFAATAGPRRTAFGFDSHPFGPEDGLRLGGQTIDAAPRLYGHSDGDAVLHALCDALLAAGGAGDLGRLFPAGEPTSKGIDSTELVRESMARIAAAGVVPVGADITITAARPRLGGHRLAAMSDTIAELLDADRTRVSVKAATGNLAGDEGAGRAISVVCLVEVVGP